MPPADEVWSESGWEEAVWFADEADFLWALCCWRGPREDQTEHWQDAEVKTFCCIHCILQSREKIQQKVLKAFAFT